MLGERPLIESGLYWREYGNSVWTIAFAFVTKIVISRGWFIKRCDWYFVV